MPAIENRWGGEAGDVVDRVSSPLAGVREVVSGPCATPSSARHFAGLADRRRAGGRRHRAAAGPAPRAGVPDVYQGGEGWALSLVYPDNRRGITPDAARVARCRSTDRRAAWATRGRAPTRCAGPLVHVALQARRRFSRTSTIR